MPMVNIAKGLAIAALIVGAAWLSRREGQRVQIPASSAYVEPLPDAPPEMLADWRVEGLLCDHCGLPFEHAAEGNYRSCRCD